jgi:hypothetical protein
MDAVQWALVAVVGVLTFAALRQTRMIAEIRQGWADHLRLHDVPAVDAGQGAGDEGAHVHTEGADWPDTDLLAPGSTLPGILRAGCRDAWCLLLLVRPDCGSCREVLASLNTVMAELSAYRVTAVGIGFEPPRLSAVDVDTARLDHPNASDIPTPAVLLADPDGVIQGRGTVDASADLVSFVVEGHHHGLGPGGSPAATSGTSS